MPVEPEPKESRENPGAPSGNTTTVGMAPILVVTDSADLGERYGRILEERGFRVRQGALGPDTLHLAWKRSFSLAIIECQSLLNLAIEIAVAVRFRSRRAPLLLFGTGSRVPSIPVGPELVAPIRFMAQPPEAAVLAGEVRALFEISLSGTRVTRRRPAKGEGARNESLRKDL